MEELQRHAVQGSDAVDLGQGDAPLRQRQLSATGEVMNDYALRATRLVCLTAVVITLIIYLQDYIH